MGKQRNITDKDKRELLNQNPSKKDFDVPNSNNNKKEKKEKDPVEIPDIVPNKINETVNSVDKVLNNIETPQNLGNTEEIDKSKKEEKESNKPKSILDKLKENREKSEIAFGDQTQTPNIKDRNNEVKKDFSVDIKGLNTGQDQRTTRDIRDYRDYIDNPLESEYLDYNRAISQSNWKKFGSATSRFAANVIPEIVNQGANVIEGIGSILGMTEERGNVVSENMKEWTEYVNSDLAPIYLKDNEKSLAFDDFGWYMDRGSSLSTSVAAFLVLGKLTGGASVFSRLTNVLSREGAKSMIKVASKELPKGEKAFNTLVRTLGSDKAKKVSSILDNITSSFALTTAEGAGVAEEVFSKTKETSYQKYVNEGMSMEEAEAKAIEDAWEKSDKAFGFNMINLALNMTSTMPFIKGLPSSRTLSLKPRTIKRSAFRLGGESAQESTEELVNFLSEKYAEEDFESFLSNLSKYVFENEALEAMLLGAVGGIGQTGLTMAGQYIPTKKVDGKWTSDRDVFNKNFAAQEEIKKGLSDLKEAKYEDLIDVALSVKDKIDSHQKVYKLQEKLSTLSEQISNSKDSENSKKLLEDYRKTNETLQKEEANSLSKVAKNAFDNGMAETLIETLESIKNEDAESLKKKGYKDDYKRKLDSTIETIKDLETVYNLTSSLIDGDRAFELKAKEIYYKRFKGDALEDYNSFKAEVENSIAELIDNSPIMEKDDSIEVTIDDGFKGDRKEDVAILYDSKYLKSLVNKIEEEKAKPKEEQNNLEQLEAERYSIGKDLQNFVENIETKEAFQRLQQQGKLINNLKENEKTFSKLYNKLISVDGQNNAYKKLMDSRFEYEVKKKQENSKRKAQNKENQKKKNEKPKVAKDPKKDTPTTTPKNSVSNDQIQMVKNINKIVSSIDSITYDEFTSLLNLSDENMIAEFYNIIQKSPENSRDTILWGYIQSNKDKVKNSPDYRVIDTFIIKSTVTPSVKNLLEKDNYIEDYKQFVNTSTVRNLAEKAEVEYSINVQDNDEDSEHASDFIKSLNQNPEKRESFFNLMSTIFEAANLNAETDSFRQIIKVLENRLGETTVNDLFYKIQGYVSMQSGKALNNRKDTFKKKDEREEEREEKKRILRSKTLEDFPLLSEKEIEEYNKRKERKEIAENGYILEEDSSLENNNYKSKSADNKLAFKSGTFVRNGVKYGELKELNEALSSEIMLGQVQPGDKLEFFIEEIHTDSDGNTYYTTQEQAEENGEKVFDENGNPVLVYKTKIERVEGSVSDFTVGNAVENAPIKVMLNGKVLNDVYLHLPSFISQINVAQNETDNNSLQEQRENLRTLRQLILEGQEVSATISEIGGGHLIKSKKQSINNNMPDAEVSIITNNMAQFNEDSFDFSDTYEGQIAVYDSSFDSPVLGNKPKVSQLQIDSIVSLMEAKLLPKASLKEKHHKLIKDVKNKYGFNLRSNNKSNYRGFNNLINNYIYTKSFDSDFEIGSVLNKLNSKQSVFYMKNFANKGIEIKAGNGGFKPLTIKFDGSNYRESDVDSAMDNLKRILKETYVNYSKAQLKANLPYSMPIVNNEGMIEEIAYNSYSDYIKNTVNVDYQTLDYNGQKIGKIQKSIFFETHYPETINHITTIEKSTSIPEKPIEESKPSMFNEDGSFNEEIEKDSTSLDDIDTDGISDDDFSITVINNSPANTYDVENIIKNEIKYKTKDGKPCAEMGARPVGVSKGYKWTIKEEFIDSPSHSTGGEEINFNGNLMVIEKNELLLINTVGDEVIIPSKYNLEVKGMVRDNCQNCLDSLINTLPVIK